MAIAIEEYIDRYVAKAEYHTERITKMHVKTRIQGQTLIILNPMPPI